MQKSSWTQETPSLEAQHRKDNRSKLLDLWKTILTRTIVESTLQDCLTSNQL